MPFEHCAVCGHHRGGALVTLTMRDGTQLTLCERCIQRHFIRDYAGEWHDLRPYRVNLHERHRSVTSFYDGPKLYYNNGVFIASQDYHEYKQRYCDRCGSVEHATDMTIVHDRALDEALVCHDCVKEILDCNEHYNACSCCGEVYATDYLRWIENEGAYVCDICYDAHYFRCEYCGGSYPDKYLRIEGDYNYCKFCYEQGVMQHED